MQILDMEGGNEDDLMPEGKQGAVTAKTYE